MNTPIFCPRNIFSESEKTFLREMIQRLDEACDKCEKCETCIFSRFCDNIESPSEVMREIISILGVNI